MNRLVQAAVVVALAAPARGGTLEILKQVWGVDNRVVPGRINLLSLEVANLSPQPFDGALRLRKSDAAQQPLGAVHLAPCYLTPGARRWVQFYPYVSGEYETWTVWWGRRADDRLELERPSNGPPGRVVLLDPDDPLTGRASPPLAVLPDSLFPPTVAATDGIHSLVLGHLPRWEPVRKQALLDWLRGGGQLHLLHGLNDRYPVFSGELEALNNPLDRFRVGAGLVVRHAVTVQQLQKGFLEERGFPAPTVVDSEESPPIYSLEDALFNNLKAVTRPKHDWALIYLTTVAYMGLIGPLHYLFGRKRRDYRLTLLLYLATVGGCAWLLGYIGRRGHGEVTTVHAVAYARQLGPDQYDVTQWANVFVTRGGTYLIRHGAPHNLYASCESLEAVRGSVLSGKDGYFGVEIPLCSSRPFLHRGKLQGDPVALKVAEWEGEDKLQKLLLDFEPGFPKHAEEMWALHRGTWYPLAVLSGKLKALINSGKPTAEFFAEHEFQIHSYQWAGFYDEDFDEVSIKTRYKRFVRPALARAVGGAKCFHYSISYPPREKDCVELFFFVRSPGSFAIQDPRFGAQRGYVLYHVSVFRPEKSP